MRVSLSSLRGHLDQGLQPLYLIFGAEVLLVEETLDHVRQVARNQGFNERLRLIVEPGFDWNQLFEQGQTMSLFAERKIIELRLPSGKPGDAGSKALVDYAQNLPPENTLVVVSGPVEKRAQNSKWFKTLEQAGVVTECPAVPADRLPDWIAQRMTGKGLKFDMEAVSHLSHLVEGNLLAASQEIDLLALLHPDETITTDIIRSAAADHARFSVYNFVDACLGGSVERSLRILQSLKQEQTEPILVVWALARDTRTICHLAALEERGQPARSQFQKFGVWSSRANLVSAALKRMGKLQWENVLRRLGQADLMSKGGTAMQRKDIWEELESICLGMCGVRLP